MSFQFLQHPAQNNTYPETAAILLDYYYITIANYDFLIYCGVSFEKSSRSELWEQIGISDVSDDVSVSVCLLESSQ